MNRRYNSPTKSWIDRVDFRKNRLVWFLDLGIPADKIVNFGCNTGEETLALMYHLDANEGIGLDINEEHIRNNQNDFAIFKEVLQTVEKKMQRISPLKSDEERAWWNTVPNFYKHKIFESTFSLEYVVQDITIPSELPSDYFDLAFCDFVLHHIWYDEDGLNQEATYSTIQEMARVIKPGGVIAIRERLQHKNKPRLDFGLLIQQMELQRIRKEEYDDEKGFVGEYCYRK